MDSNFIPSRMTFPNPGISLRESMANIPPTIFDAATLLERKSVMRINVKFIMEAQFTYAAGN